MDNLSKSTETVLTQFQLANLEQAAEGAGLIAVYEEAHTEEEQQIKRGHLAAMEDLTNRGLLTEVSPAFAAAIRATQQGTGFGYRVWSMSEQAVLMFRKTVTGKPN